MIDRDSHCPLYKGGMRRHPKTGERLVCFQPPGVVARVVHMVHACVFAGEGRRVHGHLCMFDPKHRLNTRRKLHVQHDERRNLYLLNVFVERIYGRLAVG